MLKNKGGVVKAREKRKRVYKRLEDQLRKGTKPISYKIDHIIEGEIPLEEKDIKRIKSEMSILKERI